MQVFQRLLRERDHRWKGVTRYGPLLLIPISIAVVLLCIFTIAAFIYSTVDVERCYYHSGGVKSCYTYEHTPIEWKTASHNAKEVFIRITIFLVEATHLPLHLRAYFLSRLHPVWALSLSIIIYGAWAACTSFALIYDVPPDFYGGNSDAWNSFAIFRCALGGTISLVYLVYMGFAAAAVHRWRRAKKGTRVADREEGWVSGVGRQSNGERADGMELGKM